MEKLINPLADEKYLRLLKEIGAVIDRWLEQHYDQNVALCFIVSTLVTSEKGELPAVATRSNVDNDELLEVMNMVKHVIDTDSLKDLDEVLSDEDGDKIIH